MKLLFSSASMPELGLLESLLAESGIHCEVRNANTYPNFPGAAFQPEIWVGNDKDYARACEIRDACQFSTASGSVTPEPVNRTNRFFGGLTGLLMLVLAAISLVYFNRSGAPVHAIVAIFFGCGGLFLSWLALVGWRPSR